MKLEILTKIDHIETQNLIISKIRDYINFKNLEPGDKLPSERMMSEKFETSRNNVREAIQRLEFYGILRSIPQSGTFVANIGVTALNGIIDGVLRLEQPDFKSLVETRILLELKTSKLAALRRTDADLKEIEGALEAFSKKALNGEDAVEEDLLFHLAIAKAAGNSTLNTLMLMITPEIIINFEKHHVCDKKSSLIGIEEHSAIFKAIKEKNPTEVKEKMKLHFKNLYEYCYNVKI
ncbi:FadR family transcriptional regulator [Lutibacter sp. A64]|uniref:FadR/GntR family transcriptional regulator n=1 Tax=Lutibacter sp. A64 TaxID=2918526 RepID=UPI001F05FDD4|nr:FadR/GntR family transcriptional regulator [Lutibacter sp. A64]UMB52562.1 FadR family transcriptional regulator [Lutibacter sp. A64]